MRRERAVQRGAERERGLALTGPGREHREGRRLEPEEDVVEVVEAGGDARDGGVAVVEVLELHQRLFEHRVQLHERVGYPLLGDFEDHRFGAVEGLVDLVVDLVGHVLDVAGGLDELAEHRQLRDDLRIVRRVRRRGCRGLDAQQALAAADRLDLTAAP